MHYKILEEFVVDSFYFHFGTSLICSALQYGDMADEHHDVHFESTDAGARYVVDSITITRYYTCIYIGFYNSNLLISLIPNSHPLPLRMFVILPQ